MFWADLMQPVPYSISNTKRQPGTPHIAYQLQSAHRHVKTHQRADQPRRTTPPSGISADAETSPRRLTLLFLPQAGHIRHKGVVYRGAAQPLAGRMISIKNGPVSNKRTPCAPPPICNRGFRSELDVAKVRPAGRRGSRGVMRRARAGQIPGGCAKNKKK